ncbi:MAG: tRNA lysidine(34) synthetase TilS [Gammaproteobacteria bacterium]|nr:tRNA lysidine(34) synthetase TilS [Gammaproteobacteria bacterium]
MTTGAASSAFLRRIRAACLDLIADVGSCTELVVAYSGGRDSTVLLHALAAYRGEFRLTALHVDHGLHAHSPEWARWCQTQCTELKIPLLVVPISGRPARGSSVEAWAREQRHHAFASHLTEHTMLLTAHHADDQAETFLLNAARGAGPAGLRGIAPVRRLGPGWLGRPLLAFSGDEIARHVEREDLRWIEDPSNALLDHDRNFLRHRVLPLLRERWPAVVSIFNRNAELQRANAVTLDIVADQLLAQAALPQPTRIALRTITALDPNLGKIVLRRWIERAGFPLPDAAHLVQIVTTVIGARGDRVAAVAWKGAVLRRYREMLYLGWPLSKSPVSFNARWDFKKPLALPWGVLSATPMLATESNVLLTVGAEVTIRTRLGGERCQPAGRAHGQPLKHALQERGIPPWERHVLPLIYIDEQLAAVADLFVCAPYAAQAGETGWGLHWEPTVAK